LARSTFGGYGGDQVAQDPAGNSGFYKAASSLAATGTFWSAQTGGTQYTDLIDPITTVALSGISTDTHGHIVPFNGPNNIGEGWVDFGAGRFKIIANDYPASLDARYAALPASPAAFNLYGRDGSNNPVWTTSQASVARALGWKIVTDAAYGSADPTGSVDSTTAIANALAAVTAGGVVWFPIGTFKHTGITLPNFTEIRGCGPGNTVLRNTSTTADSITSTSTNLVAVRDIQLESLVTKSAGSHLNFTSVAGYVIDNVRFIDGWNFGTFTSCNSAWFSRIKFAHGSGNINRGFWFQSCIDTHIRDVLGNGGTATLGAGLAWFQFDSGCDTVDITNLSAGASSGSGIVLYFSHSLSPSSFAPRWIKVTNFYVEGSSGTAGSGADGILIDDCLSAYFTNGYSVTGLNGIDVKGGRDIKFHQVQTMNNWLRGMVISGTTGPFDVHLNDCTFDSNSQGANNNVGHLILGGGATGVRIRDTYFGQSILSRTNKVTYAIENGLAFGNDIRVSGARFQSADYATGIIGGSQGTTGMTIRDSYGYNPKGVLGPPTVPATTVAYTNAYGVDATVHITGGTVTVIAVGGVTTGLTSGSFRVPSGSTITLTYSVAPTWVWIGD
jgi:hypothetical protein